MGWFFKSGEQKDLNRQYRETEDIDNMLNHPGSNLKAKLIEKLNELFISIDDEYARVGVGTKGRGTFIYAHKVIPLGHGPNVELPQILEQAINRKSSIINDFRERVRKYNDDASIVAFSRRMLTLFQNVSRDYFHVIDILESSKPFASADDYDMRVRRVLKKICDPSPQLRIMDISTAEPVRANK